MKSWHLCLQHPCCLCDMSSVQAWLQSSGRVPHCCMQIGCNVQSLDHKAGPSTCADPIVEVRDGSTVSWTLGSAV